MSYDPVANPGGGSPRTSSFDEHHPQASFHDSQANMSFSSSQPINNAPYRDDATGGATSGLLADKEAETGYPPSPPLGDAAYGKKRSRLPQILAIAALALVVIVVAVVVPVYFKVIKPNNNNASSASDSGTGSSGSGSSGNSGTGTGSTGKGTTQNDAIIGYAGSTVTTETGATFVYNNTFGGFWYFDPANPYADNAQAQSFSKPLNQSWDFQNDKIRGVNCGGWLVPEPFIVPAMYEPFVNTSLPAVDEWTLSQNLAANGGLQQQMEAHYSTFYTEEDFAQIAAAGLNWVRIPIPFWVIQTYDGEPFLEGVAWKYALKAFQWARKYGLRVNLDLHTMPGSQNGYNHSGKLGQVDWLNGVMGMANAQRGLDYQRIITEFITQPEYANLIPMFGVANEALTTVIGMDVIGSYYREMHDYLRNITGYGEGNGPWLAIHDGFQELSTWAGFLPGRDRMSLDTHPYLCFTDQDNTPLAQQVTKPCETWASVVNTSWTAFGVTTAGEWSLAINDCGLWVNGVGLGSRYDGTFAGYTGPVGTQPGGCTYWNDYQSWTPDMKQDFQQIALATMDALQNWFFWTWKIGPSSVSGQIEAPFWSYSLGLQEGWMPTDPRLSEGVCGGTSPAGQLTPDQLGAQGSWQGWSESVLAANPWPPTTLQPSGYAATALPQYTQSASVITLGMPTFTAASKTVSAGDGWFDAADQLPMYTPVASCTYPNAWDATAVAVPAACGNAQGAAVAAVPAAATRTTAAGAAAAATRTTAAATTSIA